MASRRWTIHSTHPAAEQHPPKPDCENCDGRGCMGCVLREYDHECADDCPVCCVDNFENTPIEVMPVDDALAALEEAVAELEKEADRSQRIAGEESGHAPASYVAAYLTRAAANRNAASLLRTHLDRLRGEGKA